MPDSPSDKAVSPASFPPARRLLRKNGFNEVLHAESLTDKHFKIFFARNSNKNARLGIIVAKKTLPGAVSRNRVKRIIRETFRQHDIRLRELDLVVMVRRAYSQLKEDGAQADNLKVLFSRVESRCAE